MRSRSSPGKQQSCSGVNPPGHPGVRVLSEESRVVPFRRAARFLDSRSARLREVYGRNARRLRCGRIDGLILRQQLWMTVALPGKLRSVMLRGLPNLDLHGKSAHVLLVLRCDFLAIRFELQSAGSAVVAHG